MKIGDKVKWTMFDGNTMAGTITESIYGRFWIRRVDGTLCSICASRVTPATPDDVLKACQFFERNKA